jgi:hypothetical protein
MFEVHLYLPLKIKTIILVATNKKVKLNQDVFVRTEGLDTMSPDNLVYHNSEKHQNLLYIYIQYLPHTNRTIL